MTGVGVTALVIGTELSGVSHNGYVFPARPALPGPAGGGVAARRAVLLDASPAGFAAFRTSFRGPLVWQARGPGTQATVAGAAQADERYYQAIIATGELPHLAGAGSALDIQGGSAGRAESRPWLAGMPPVR